VDDDADDDRYRLDLRFRRALDSILDLVVLERCVRDSAGEIVDFEIYWMNDAPVDVAGRPREELIGRRISEMYPALAGGELIAGYRRVVETGEPLVVPVMPYEDVIDGRQVSGFYTVQATKFEDGVLVASRDITPLETSRRELEVALRELEAAQRLAQLGTWQIDLVAGTAVLSGELQRMFGLPAGASAEEEFASLIASIDPDDLDLVGNAYQRATETRRAVAIEHRVIRGEAGPAHVRTYMEPLVVEGAVVGIWGTTQDISDAVASREALTAEQSRRISAEALADLASQLNGARSEQEIADALAQATSWLGDIATAVFAIVEPGDPSILRHYFGGTGLPGDIQARFLRTPLAVDTHITRPVNEERALFLGTREEQAAEFPALMNDVDAAEVNSAAVLPLRRTSGAVFGAVGIAVLQECEFDGETRATLFEVAAVVARAAERLELLDLERSVARTLQLGLLALDVRSTTAIVRARYRASDATLEIGGDWYDAVEIDGGRLAIAVGDVVGQGLPAATTMGQLRAALGVTAMQADDAADAITILDNYAQHVPGAKCTTVAFAVVDPVNQSVSYAVAGHPPPVIVTPDGSAGFLEGARSWPLGIDVRDPRPAAASASLPPGSLLVLYTDGLVERRGESIDVGLDRLRRVVAQYWNLPLRRLKNAIFRELVDESDAAASDDIALVAVRTTGAAPLLFVDIIPAKAEEAIGARHRLRTWLDAIGVTLDRRDQLVLAVGEAVANAIDHGSERDDSQVVRVEVAVRGDELVASVSDAGQWQPGAEGYFTGGRGRGHLLMQALTDDVHIDTDQQGTIVTLVLSMLRESV
jgi:anti-sigma regulatory factor (Ser/Thr protein kinase)/PAS domain-containing protein